MDRQQGGEQVSSTGALEVIQGCHFSDFYQRGIYKKFNSKAVDFVAFLKFFNKRNRRQKETNFPISVKFKN